MSTPELLPMVYAQLHAAARRLMTGERPSHTLQPTALVGEAYARLAHTLRGQWSGTREFYFAAARRADINNDGEVDSADFFEFLSAFVAGTAEFNDDGLTNSQDFFDFLTAFFAGCA